MDKNVGRNERIARLAMGGALLLLGRRLRRTPAAGFARRLLGRGMTLAGGNLLTTAVTQRCPGNSMLGRNTYEKADQGVVDRAADVVTDRSRPATS